MKRAWCWREKREVPWFSDAEWERLTTLRQAIQEKKGALPRSTEAEEERMIRELYEPLHDLYREITGEDYSDPVGMQFRKLDDLGPLCSGCGKPLRTPLAAKCMVCARART